MKISDLDSNLTVSDGSVPDSAVWMDAKSGPFRLYGVFYDRDNKRYTRMPEHTAEKISDDIRVLVRCTAGGRIRFKTNSPFIGIKAVMKNYPPTSHMTRVGQCGFDLYGKDETGKEVFKHAYLPPADVTEGYSSLYQIASKYYDGMSVYTGKMIEYTLNFPNYDGVEELYIALDKDSALEAASDYADIKPIVYYGSSITQGACASRPGNCYEHLITRMLNIDHINMGFSGNAKGEPEMADYLAGLDMGAFVCDYDHNAQNAQQLTNTLPYLYGKIRSAHPYIPFIFVSAPDIRLFPEVWTERRQAVYEAYLSAVKNNDKNVCFVDGKSLYEGEFSDSCTVDGCHPNDIGFYRMALKIGAQIKIALNL